MKIKLAFLLTLLLVPLVATAQQREPKIGYLYPAGGQQGTTFRILVGGRQIARSTDVVVSGPGVQGRIIRGFPRLNINSAEENFVARQIYEAAKKQVEGEENLPESEERFLEAVRKQLTERGLENLGLPKMLDPKALPSPDEVIQRFPYLDLLTTPTEDDLQKVFYEYFAPRSDKKPKEAIGQGVFVEITIDPDAEPGDHDLRLAGPVGLTPPFRFMVGTLPEVTELEPNDTDLSTPMEVWGRRIGNAPKTLRQLPVQDLPVVMNGQIRAGDVDRFQFKARRGQKVVVDVRARHLTPYLADGVPGWFQAVVFLYDSKGRKLDEAMSYRHEVDPVLLVEIPKDGVYTLEIQDSIFRGRDDFVYRITVGELPFVTSMFPLGVQSGQTAGADVDGWNLPEKAILFDSEKLETGVHEISSIGDKPLLRPLRFAVDDLPDRNEKEPNNDLSTAEKVDLPIIVNGRISDENDVDCFVFEGRKGQKIVLDVAARSLDSPLDAVVELSDSTGRLIASNDDRADSKGPNIGLETHHADPYLITELPADGKYFVRIYDATQNGGKEYGYRLRISPPQADFALFCEPSSLVLRGNSQPLKIRTIRKDGFEGEIVLRPANEVPFRIEKGIVPAGATKTTVDLFAARNLKGGTTEVFIEAVAVIDGKEIVRPVVAVDDWEQAFIYHHWVPARSLMIRKPGFGFRNRGPFGPLRR